MAVLDDMVVTAPNVAPEDLNVDAIKLSIARQFWAYYDRHSDDVLIRQRILWVTLAIRLRDLRPLFTTLFGNPR